MTPTAAAAAPAAPMASALWARVAGLRPRLRAHARVERHVYRGELQYVIVDGLSRRVHRHDARAEAAIALLDGQRTVASIAAALAALPQPWTADELLRLLAQLHQAELLATELPPDVAQMLTRRAWMARRKAQAQWLAGPLSLRVPLFDPQRALDATAAWWRAVFSVPGAVIWLMLVGSAAVGAAAHTDELTHHLADRVLSAGNLLLLALAFPVVKAAHEWAHAAAVHRWGGEVHEMGVMVLVFFPVPYVDASAASGFPGKWPRVVVGAAGMAAELALAAVAFAVWRVVDDGLLHALCFNVMLIAGISTLVFNANPLLRYDGYYILADMLEMPNLKARANRQWSEWFDRIVARLPNVPTTEPPARRPWLMLYGALSGAYRVFVSASIIGFVAVHYLAVGIGLALWATVGMLLLPLWKGLQALRGVRYRQAARARLVVGAGAIALLVGAAFLLPLPTTLTADGIVWVRESAVLRAAVDGVAAEWLAQPGDVVRSGQPLLRMEEPALQARHAVAQARRDEHEALYRAAQAVDPAKAQLARTSVATAARELAAAQDRLASLLVLSPHEGELVVARAADLTGRWLRRGQAVGYVRPLTEDGRASTLVRVPVPQQDIDRLRAGDGRAEVLTAAAGATATPARVGRLLGAPTDRMPNLALTALGGGPVTVDPSRPAVADESPPALDRWYLVELSPVLAAGETWPLGQHVKVRFQLPEETLAARITRWARQSLLRALHG